MKVLLSQLNPIVGDTLGNKQKVLMALKQAKREKADMVLFPEMALSGYPPEDLLFFQTYLEQMALALEEIIQASKGLFVVVGLPRVDLKTSKRYNSAAVICDQKLLGFKDKTLLPTYDVFNEKRYFHVGEEQKVFDFQGKKIGVLICEDIWGHSQKKGGLYQRDPVAELKKLQPDLVVNLSASPYYFRKREVREQVFSSAAKTLKTPILCCNQVGGNDQLVFDGYSFFMDVNGKILETAKGFIEENRLIDLSSFSSSMRVSISNSAMTAHTTPVATTSESVHHKIYYADPWEDLYQALVLGTRDYFVKQGFTKACLGLSGGIDSALVAYIAKEALGKENVLAVSMPSRYSSLASFEDAKELVKRLGIELRDIPIDHIFQTYLDLLSPIFVGKSFDTTEENLQARIRGMVLMALSNKWGYIVLSTGNKSEMAMGYTTLYGDMAGGLGVINDVSKTQIYQLVDWINQHRGSPIPKSIIKKAPSAELRPNQKDSDSLPDYRIVDAVLQDYVEDHLSVEKIAKRHKISRAVVSSLIQKIHLAEYKRRQGPIGIHVTKRSFSKGRFFPIVHKWMGG